MNDKKIIKKNYNSIGHFSFSRLGPSDHYICEGHEKILTKNVRDWKDLIIVTEKLDGSNVGIIKKNGKIFAITRSGYVASSSNYEQHILFEKWVNNRYLLFDMILNEKERICGEWLLKTHGTKYVLQDVEHLFFVFDYFNSNNESIPYIKLRDICKKHNLQMPELLHIGQPVNIRHIEKKLQEIEKDRIDKCEGAVYRCERGGKFDIIAKYVRKDKIDGLYMNEDTYNFDKTLI